MQLNRDAKVHIAGDKKMVEWFSSEKVLDLLLDDDFDLSDSCSTNEECTEGSSQLGNDELHPQDLNDSDRVVNSAGEASSGRGSSDEKMMKIWCLLLLRRMKMKV